MAVLLVYLLFRYFMSSSEATTSARWLKLDDVVFPEQLETVLADNDLKDTPQGLYVHMPRRTGPGKQDDQTDTLHARS